MLFKNEINTLPVKNKKITIKKQVFKLHYYPGKQ